MHPDERDALTKAHSPWSRAIMALVITALIMLLGIPIASIRQPGFVEHFLGQSTEATATVTSISKVEYCGRNNRHQFTLTWTEGSTQRTETIGRCGDPWEVGDEVSIWSTSGIPQTQPPWVLQMFVALAVLGILAAACAVNRTRRKVMAQTRSARDGTWQPIALPTVGMPGTQSFVINPQQPLAIRRLYRAPWIYRPDRPANLPPTIPGTLYVTTIKNNRVRGLSLHVSAANTRQWQWQG